MKLSRKIFYLSPFVLLILGWLLFIVAGRAASEWVVKISGEQLTRISDRKFNDSAGFIHERLFELLALTSLLVVLLYVGVAIHLFLKRKTLMVAHAIGGGLTAYVLLNVYLYVCGNTALFWMALYSPVDIDNFVQYQIKRILRDEVKSERRAVILGNSQANRSIDETILNQQLGDSLWTTDLTQPGARGFDMLVLSRDTEWKEGDILISYISEVMFYGGGSGVVVSDFIHFGDLKDLNDLNGWSEMEEGSVTKGLLGRVVPSYRYGASFSKRILGADISSIRQRDYDAALEEDLDKQGENRSSAFSVDAGSRFQLDAFERMAGELVAAGGELVLIDGYVHPALDEQMPVLVREDMSRFLRELKKAHGDKVAIIKADELLPQSSESFDDLVHFSEDAQAKFSQRLADELKQMY